MGRTKLKQMLIDRDILVYYLEKFQSRRLIVKEYSQQTETYGIPPDYEHDLFLEAICNSINKLEKDIKAKKRTNARNYKRYLTLKKEK